MKIPSIKGRKTGRKGIAIGTDMRMKRVPVVCNETGDLKGYTFKKCL